jgi:hypothetical protein
LTKLFNIQWIFHHRYNKHCKITSVHLLIEGFPPIPRAWRGAMGW